MSNPDRLLREVEPIPVRVRAECLDRIAGVFESWIGPFILELGEVHADNTKNSISLPPTQESVLSCESLVARLRQSSGKASESGLTSMDVSYRDLKRMICPIILVGNVPEDMPEEDVQLLADHIKSGDSFVVPILPDLLSLLKGYVEAGGKDEDRLLVMLERATG